MSVYPKKELPFFILFTAGLCSITALLALLTHQYPEPMGSLAKIVSKLIKLVIVLIDVINLQLVSWLSLPLGFFIDKMEALLPSSLLQQLSRI